MKLGTVKPGTVRRGTVEPRTRKLSRVPYGLAPWLAVMMVTAVAAVPRMTAEAAVQASAAWESTGGETGDSARLELQLAPGYGDGDVALSAIQIDVILEAQDALLGENDVNFEFGQSLGAEGLKREIYDENSGELTLFVVPDEETELTQGQGPIPITVGTLKVTGGKNVTAVISRVRLVANDRMEEPASVRNVRVLLKKDKDTPSGEDPNNPGGSGGSGSGSGGSGGSGNGSGGSGSGSGGSGSGSGGSGNGSGSGSGGSGSGSGGSGGSSGGSGGGGGGSRGTNGVFGKTTGSYDSPRKTALETKGTWLRIGERWKFRLPTGLYAKDTWIYVKNLWYHIGKDGNMDTGWYRDKEAWYFLMNDGQMKKGWLDLNGTWYYLNTENGRMVTGWITDGTYWYYLNPDGAMAVGWQTVGGNRYYFNAEPQTAGGRSYGAMDKSKTTAGSSATGGSAAGGPTVSGPTVSGPTAGGFGVRQ